MGSTLSCQSCRTCGEFSLDYVLGQFFLEPFQVPGAVLSQLNKYDKFYKIAADPLHQMNVTDFIEQINALALATEEEYERNNPTVRFNLDQVPYVKFLTFFKKKREWASHIKNLDSPFMKLLQLDDVFFTKKVVKDTRPVTPPRRDRQGRSSVSPSRASPDHDSSISHPIQTSIKKQMLPFEEEESHIRSVQIIVQNPGDAGRSRNQNLISSTEPKVANSKLEVPQSRMSSTSNRAVNFNQDTSQILTVRPDGTEMLIQLNVDLFSLKIFSLLMCRGSVREKAEALFDIALGPEGVKQERDSIAWKSGRMVKAFKKLIYFSEIFPKKFWAELIPAGMHESLTRQSINYKIQSMKGDQGMVDLPSRRGSIKMSGRGPSGFDYSARSNNEHAYGFGPLDPANQTYGASRNLGNIGGVTTGNGKKRTSSRDARIRPQTQMPQGPINNINNFESYGTHNPYNPGENPLKQRTGAFPAEEEGSLDGRPQVVIHSMLSYQPTEVRQQLFMWSEDYVEIVEEKFSRIFQEIYEEKFIDNIFMTNESLITRDDFKTAIAGDLDEGARCKWLFRPSEIRQVFWKSRRLQAIIKEQIALD